MARVAKWRMLLFSRRVSPSEIDAMDFATLRHWGELAQIQLDAELAALPPQARPRK